MITTVGLILYAAGVIATAGRAYKYLEQDCPAGAETGILVVAGLLGIVWPVLVPMVALGWVIGHLGRLTR